MSNVEYAERNVGPEGYLELLNEKEKYLPCDRPFELKFGLFDEEGKVIYWLDAKLLDGHELRDEINEKKWDKTKPWKKVPEEERRAALDSLLKNKRVKTDQEMIQDLIDALEFYADPASYHAIAFLTDPPCGGFADDFDEDHGDDFYDRPMPGKKAREVLREFMSR